MPDNSRIVRRISNENTNVASASQVLFVARWFVVSAGFVLSIATARLLGPDGRGILAYVSTITSLMVVFGNLGFGAFNTFGASRNPADSSLLYWNSLLVMGVVVLITAGLFSATMVLGLVSDEKKIPLLVGWCGFPFVLIVLYQKSILLGTRAYYYYAWSLILTSLLSLIGTFIVLWVRPNPQLVIAINSVVPAIVFVWLHIVLAKKLSRLGFDFKLGFSSSLLRQGISYGFLAYLGAAFQLLNLRFDNLIVDGMMGASALGIYSISASLGDTISHFSFSLGTVVFPMSSSQSDENAAELTLKAARVALLLTIISALGLAILAPFLITNLYGSEYKDALSALWILLPGLVALAWVRVISQYINGRGKPGYTTVAFFASALITVVLDFALIPPYGILGAAIASTIAYILTALIVGYFWKRLSGVSFLAAVIPQPSDVGLIFRWIAGSFHKIRAFSLGRY